MRLQVEAFTNPNREPHMNGMILWIVVPAILGATASVRAQVSPDSIKLRDNCRFAVQTVGTGQPAPKLQWARAFLANCERTEWARASAAALTRLRNSTDESALSREWVAVRMLRDARLLAVAQTIARDRSASTPARLLAVRYLAGLLDLEGRYNLDLVTEGVPPQSRAVRPICSSGVFTGGQARFTGEELPADYRQQIRAIGSELASGESEPDVLRRSGQCVVYLADGHTGSGVR